MSLNSSDLYRLEILTKVKEKRLKQSKAARFLRISTRQVRAVAAKIKK